jgi:hypothetical protein
MVLRPVRRLRVAHRPQGAGDGPPPLGQDRADNEKQCLLIRGGCKDWRKLRQDRYNLCGKEQGLSPTLNSDVILHIRYMARQGVEPAKVNTVLDKLFRQANQSNLTLLFSLRHDFPTEWAAFINGTVGAAFTATIHKGYVPYFTRGKTLSITGLTVYMEPTYPTARQLLCPTGQRTA